MIKVRAHTCYLGHTGFAAHARNFFRELSKHVDLRVRNYTWDSNPSYLDKIDYSILDKITLSNSDNTQSDYPISYSFPNLPWENKQDFQQDVDIVLMEMCHKYFYEDYNAKIKIAYTVWESTELDQGFFNQLLKFDYLWVVTQWHKDMIIKQGYPEDKVFVVNEGVNSIFFDHIESNNDKFKFMFFGRWDYRKAVPEIIDTFLKSFPNNNNNVELILSADNPYSVDGFNSTEERLKHYNYNDKRIKVLHFPKYEEYVNYIKTGNVLITCARSEGWNIPLIEAMAAGTPVIYSNWGAQLEFTQGLGNPVAIRTELPANIGRDLGFAGDTPGLYAEPDYNDLQRVLIDCHDNYQTKKESALKDSQIIKEKFNWNKIGIDGYNTLKKIIDINMNSEINKREDKIIVKYLDGPFVEVLGDSSYKYLVKFIDSKDNKILYESVISPNHWTACSIKYFVKWRIQIENLSTKEITIDEFNLDNKIVRVSLDSSSLGDTLAWTPHVNEFAEKNNCTVIISTFKNFLFDTEKYPRLHFVNPGVTYENTYCNYMIGWFYDDFGVNFYLNPREFKNVPLQATTSDILGLGESSIKPFLKVNNTKSPLDTKYICIAIHSTAQAKYWNNPTGWQDVVDHYKLNGYEVVIVSSEHDGYMGNPNPKDVLYMKDNSMDTLMTYLYNCETFIGISSGISWLSWALNKKTVIISGFSKPVTEPLDDNVIRIFNESVCNGCFNSHRLDAGDWNWCPINKGTNKQFECSKSITSNDVITAIENYTKSISERDVESIIQESYNLGMTQNHKEILGAAEFFKNLKVHNFMEIGTDKGGSFAIWSKLSTDGIRVSVDLPHGNFGTNTYDPTKRDNYLRSLGSNVHTYWGDSHSLDMLKKVEQRLNGLLLDFMFIDGDHTYEGVKADFEMYKHLVKPGGWIAFHDIKDTEFHRSANCRVDQLWSELEGNKHEFVDWTSNYGGIGFIQV